jgi:hypothetical protein
MDEILEGFREETKGLLQELGDILEEVEEDLSKNQKLEDFGQRIDRIMGAAKTLNVDFPHPVFNDVGAFAEVCKIVGYKASQLKNQPDFCNIVVAFLLDAVDVLNQIVDQLKPHNKTDINQLIPKTFLDRLRFIASKFDTSLRATLGSTASSEPKLDSQKSSTAPSAKEDAAQTQNTIDDLLKQLGVTDN